MYQEKEKEMHKYFSRKTIWEQTIWKTYVWLEERIKMDVR
jgi:hypothetical protein